MILTYLLRWLVPGWDALIENPQTGKPSAKSLFASMSFLVGIALAVAAVAADISEKRPVEKSAIMLLLANGSLLAGLKVYQQQANRRTADETGQPLAVPPPANEPPAVMPQVPNPNTPEPPVVLAGYSNGQVE